MPPFRVGYWVPAFGVVIVSTVLHLRLLLTIRQRQRKGEYKSLFYRIFVLQSLIDLVLLFFYLAFGLVTRDQPQGGDFLLSTNGRFFGELYYYGSIYYFMHVQWLDAPPDWAWCLVNLAVPLAVLFRLLLLDDVNFVRNANGDVVMQIPPEVTQTAATQATIVTSVGTVISALCYAFILRKLVVSKQQLKQDIRETLALQPEHVLFFRNLNFIPLLLTFVNPWMLAIASKSLRKRILGRTTDSEMAVRTLNTTTGRESRAPITESQRTYWH